MLEDGNGTLIRTGTVMRKLCDTNSISVRAVKNLRRCLADESGATAIEYGLMAAMIGLMIITGATALGSSINQQFTDIAALLSGPPERGGPAAPGPPVGPGR